MGSPPKYLRIVLFLAVAGALLLLLLLLLLFLTSQPVGSPVRSSSTAGGIAASGTGLFPDDGRGRTHQVEVVSGEDNAGGGLIRSLVADSFRALLRLASGGRRRPTVAGHGALLAPAPAPGEAESTAAPAPVRLPRLPVRGYSRSPLPRPSLIPPVDDADLRKRTGGGARGRAALWIVAAAAVSAAATLAVVALAVAIVRHRSRRGKMPGGGSGVAGGKMGFDPGAELFYLDTFAPGTLPCHVSGAEHSSVGDGGSTPSRSPARSPPREADESEDHESFHSLSACNSHSDASEASNPAQPPEPPEPAFSPPFALQPPSSPPSRGLGFGRRVSFCPEVSLSQPPLSTNVAAAPPPSSVFYGGVGASCSALSPPPFRWSSRRSDPRLPLPSPCTDYSHDHAATTQTRGATPSSSSSASNAATGSSAIPASNQSAATPPVGNVSGPGPLLPPATPFLPPPPPPPPPLAPPSSKKVGSPGQLPPPPPPPLGLVQPSSTPVGKDGSPLPKLKPLHWDKVRAAPDRSMVWDKIRSSSFELDEEMIGSLFGYNLHGGSGRSEEPRSKASSPGKHVLDPKRLQNFTILLKALNATSDQICAALLTGTGLCAQQLEALVKMVPTKEEEEKLLCFEGGAGELDPAERFVRDMLSIPLCFPRVEAMLYRETFEDEVAYLKKSFETLEEACRELRSSRLFLRLLDAVLKTGNRMNVGTTRGGARAFKLDALLKLADVKGTDGKTTLLHFVVQEIVRSEGGGGERSVNPEEDDGRAMGVELVAGLSTELRHVKTTAGVDLDALAGSVTNLSGGLRSLQRLLERRELDGAESPPVGGFAQSMRSFSGEAGRAIGELEEEEARVFRLVREITEYYHGDVDGKEEGNPLGIFVVVRDFLAMLDRVCKEVWSCKGGHHSSSPSAMAAPFR